MKYYCIRQHDMTDCGAACIATISKQYGFTTSISKIREVAGTTGVPFCAVTFLAKKDPLAVESVREIEADMESDRNMDRLLCGDVGYGKTEVSLRAAFKAVMDGKQVALLAPTTILVQQHYNTVVKRFHHSGARVD